MIRTNSLKNQLTISQILITTGVLVASAMGFLLNDVYLASKAMDRIVTSTASVISQNLITPLTFEDEKEAKKTLDSLTGHPVIEGAAVLDKSGKIFATFTASADGKAPDITNAHYRFGVSNSGEKLGQLVLLPKNDFNPESYLGYVLVLIVVLGGGVLMSRWLSLMFTKNLVSQVDELLNAARNIRESGNYTLRADASQISTTEIVRLASEFNEMVSTVESHNSQIENMNKNLEKTVEERTKELVEMQASMVQSSRMSAIGEMSAGVAHEINNPLAMIAGRSRKLRRLVEAPGFNPPDAIESLNVIDNTVQRIVKVIKGLKGLARDGDNDPFAPVKLHTIVADTVEFCGERFKTHGVDLQIQEIDPELTISCRATQLEQVLLNLLNNAHDAVENEPEKWVNLSIEKLESWVEIYISDSGPGIPPHVREKLMKPFFTTKAAGKGTGLGLSISKKIIEAHGGSLTLDPDIKRTKFVIRIPLSFNS